MGFVKKKAEFVVKKIKNMQRIFEPVIRGKFKNTE